MSETTERSDLEEIEEFYKLLVEHEIPDGYRMPNLPPRMTGEQAFSLIWFLQERLRCLPDNIKRCGCCDSLADEHSEFVRYVKSKKEFLCESCYQAEQAYECCGAHCDNHDCHEKPGRLVVMTEEVQGMEAGLYRIKDWPFYANGVIDMYVHENALERVGELPPGVNTDGYAMGFLCSECEKKIDPIGSTETK